jgi:nicotinate-nucleotide pyrophosphorylase (carboxylating)
MDLDTQLAKLIEQAFEEDGQRDVTSELLFDGDEEKEAMIIAKDAGVICGVKFMETIVNVVDDSIVVDPYVEEGDRIKNRMMLSGMSGKVVSLLRVERVLLNFMSRLSGIASHTARFVAAVEGTGAVILDTRKTVPAWRYLDKYAVTVGGGINHRMNLEDVAVIKDVHVDAAGSVDEAITRFRSQDADVPLIAEVRSIDELNQALQHAKLLTRIMLDNFSSSQMREAVQIASGRILLEASGNITLENVRDVAETGVHFLSIGALTHSAPAFDLSLHISS